MASDMQDAFQQKKNFLIFVRGLKNSTLSMFIIRTIVGNDEVK